MWRMLHGWVVKVGTSEETECIGVFPRDAFHNLFIQKVPGVEEA